MPDQAVTDLAGRVSRYLPGWGLDAVQQGYGAAVTGPGRLWFMPPSKGRVEISGSFPDTTLRTDGHSISVSASRPPAVIANEIKARLLPGYLARLAVVNEHNAAEERATAVRAEVLARFAAMFPDGHVREIGRQQRGEALIHPPRCGRGSVEAYGDASAVHIDLHDVPQDLAVLMLKVLQQHKPAPGQWERDCGGRRWTIADPHGDGKDYQVTDEAIRTFGRHHLETRILAGLPPLPEVAWDVHRG